MPYDDERLVEHRVDAWTVGDLRRAIADLPDDVELVVSTAEVPGGIQAGPDQVIIAADPGHDWIAPVAGQWDGRWVAAHRLELVAEFPSGSYYAAHPIPTVGAVPASSTAPTVEAEAEIDSAGYDATGSPALPDAAAPAWVDGYLTGHDRGVSEGREAGYAEYEGHIREGIAGMLAGDPKVTDYREGVRIHERSVAAKQSREVWDRANRLPDAHPADLDTPGPAEVEDNTRADADGWEA